jgi:uncharacterized protein YybS (DUF2232 family)
MCQVGIAIVVTLALVAVGIVIDQLFRLRKWMKNSPRRDAGDPPDGNG